MKESIRDPPWKSGCSSTESFVHGQTSGEISGEDITAIGERDDSKDDALRFIPRKRTHTDHVITPKKPLRQTHLNAQAQTLQMGSDEYTIDKPVRRRKSMRHSLRKSMGKKLSETALSAPSHGPVPGLDTYTGTTLSDVGIQEAPEAVPEVMSIRPNSAVESESIEVNRESHEDYIFGGTNIPQARRRAISPRYSRRSTRNSMRRSSVTEDAVAQCSSTIEAVGSQLAYHVATEELSDTNISGGSMTQAANSISTSTTPVEVQPDAIEGIDQSEESTAHHLDGILTHQLEEHVQPAEQEAESSDNPPLIESTLTIPRPVQQQDHMAEPEQIQTTEPYALEVPITYDSIASPEEAPEEPQSELAGHADESFCQSVDNTSGDSFPASNHTNATSEMLLSETEDQRECNIQLNAEESLTLDAITVATEESSTADLLASEVPQNIPANTPSGSYEDDDTEMLRKFVTRVKADKAAKAENATPQRKRSLPHSPLRIPLGDIDASTSPSPPRASDEFDISSAPSPTKRRKRDESMTDKDAAGELKTIRRSGRTRLPVMKAPLAAPSLIPVRRLGQDGDTTITLRRNEEKEIAARTRINTRKNKGGALTPAEVLILKAEEKTDPVLKQRFLKEMFEDKKKKGETKSETRKSVAWAKELTQYQTVKKREKSKDKDKTSKGSSSAEKRKDVAIGTPKSSSSITVGKLVNGTPGPKRVTRERA